MMSHQSQNDKCEFAGCGREANKYGVFSLGEKIASYCYAHAKVVKFMLKIHYEDR